MPSIKDIDYHKLMSLRRMTDDDIRAAHTRVLIEHDTCPRCLDEALASQHFRHLITLQVIETLSAEDAATQKAHVLPIKRK